MQRLLLGLAVVAGILLRLAWAGALPISLLGDEVKLVGPALGATGAGSDFADAFRPIPCGWKDPHEVIGGFRIAAGGSSPAAGERVVQRVRDACGREWAVALGRAQPWP